MSIFTKTFGTKGRVDRRTARDAVGLSDRSTVASNRPGGDAAAAFMSQTGSRRTFLVNVLVAIDVSTSEPQQCLDYVSQKAIGAIISHLHKTEQTSKLRYNLGVLTFSTDAQMALPFTLVSDLVKTNYAFPPLEAHGVTNHEAAYRLAFSEIDRIKQQQDAARQNREGTLLIMITDGCSTDMEGRRAPLPQQLVDDIAQRSAKRQTITLAFGLGNADEDTLSLLAPGFEIQTRDGGIYENPHAFLYQGDYESTDVWERITEVVALASSSTGCTSGGRSYQLETVFVRSGDKVPPEIDGDFVSIPASMMPVRKAARTCS